MSNNADLTFFDFSKSPPKTNYNRSEDIFLGPERKFLVIKSWSSEVVTEVCICLF